MRKVLLSTLVVLSSLSSSAQSERHPYYCRINGRTNVSGKVNNWLEWGEEKKTVHLEDDNGKKIDFKNTMDFLNYMAERGWVFVTVVNQEIGVDFLLKKDVSSPEDAKEGLRFDTDK